MDSLAPWSQSSSRLAAVIERGCRLIGRRTPARARMITVVAQLLMTVPMANSGPSALSWQVRVIAVAPWPVRHASRTCPTVGRVMRVLTFSKDTGVTSITFGQSPSASETLPEVGFEEAETSRVRGGAAATSGDGKRGIRIVRNVLCRLFGFPNGNSRGTPS